MDEELRELLETIRRENAAAWKANDARWERNEAQWERNEARWERNEAQWERNEAQWERNEAQWEQNEAQWEQNQARWEANDALWANNAAAHAATRAQADSLFAQVSGEIADLRRHIDVRFEEQGANFDRLAEAMTLLDEKVDRRADALDDRIERTTADTQALIRFAHQNLDQRVRILEQS